MNLQLYEATNARIIELQKLLQQLNPRYRRKTKAELVAKAIDEGLTWWHTSDTTTLTVVEPGLTVFVRVPLDEDTINAVSAVSFNDYSNQQKYNALALRGAERLIKNLRQKVAK